MDFEKKILILSIIDLADSLSLWTSLAAVQTRLTSFLEDTSKLLVILFPSHDCNTACPKKASAFAQQ